VTFTVELRGMLQVYVSAVCTVHTLAAYMDCTACGCADIHVYASFPGAGAALVGAAVGIPLLLKAKKGWDQTM